MRDPPAEAGGNRSSPLKRAKNATDLYDATDVHDASNLHEAKHFDDAKNFRDAKSFHDAKNFREPKLVMAEHHPAPPANGRELLGRLFAPVRELFNEPLPRGVGFLHTTGSMCLFMAFLQIVTGVLMAFYYTPSPDVAYESIKYVEGQVSFGKIIHGLHHWGSSAFVVLIFIHMLRVFTFAAYKGSRKWTWVVGVFLLLVVLGFGFTGYLLPWDMKAYFGTKVGTNIVGYAPAVGPYARRFLLGGSEITELTLPRFYSLHVLILPAALVALIGAHLFLVRLFGITPPFKREGEAVDYPTRFFPEQAIRDSTMVLLLFCSVLSLTLLVGGDLGDKADPNNTTFAPHPEWYFLGLQQLLRYFEGPYQIFGTVLIPGGAILAMLLLPFIDRNPERQMAKRPFALTVAALAVVFIVGLTVQGYTHLQTERADLMKVADEQLRQKSDETNAAKVAKAAAKAGGESAATGGAVPAVKAFTTDQVEFGERLYQVLQCADCHAGKKSGKGANVPPSLDYAGDRFLAEWLIKYMHEVPPRRFQKEGKRPLERMPDFKMKPVELEGITAHLMTLHKPDLFGGAAMDLAEPTEGKVHLGERLFEKESCETCHKLNGKGDDAAPDLTGVGSRLKPDFIFKIIKEPQKIVPGTTMQDSFMNDQEIEALTYYLMSLK